MKARIKSRRSEAEEPAQNIGVPGIKQRINTVVQIKGVEATVEQNKYWFGRQRTGAKYQ